MVTAFGHISGGHFNPAITLGFLVTRRIEAALAGVYWLMQFAGAAAAALLLWWIFPKEAIAPARLGAPLLHPSIGQGAGFALEAIMTAFLVLAVFATAVDERGAFKAVAGFGIGLVITMGVLAGGPLTGRGDEPVTRLRPGDRLQRLGELHLDLLRRPCGRVVRSPRCCTNGCISGPGHGPSRSARPRRGSKSRARAISPPPRQYARAVDSFQTADGRTLAFRREGSGPILVCHPGGPGFSSRYFADLAGLGDGFELILLHPRGTEGSDRPADSRAYQTADYVADLESLRDHLGLERMLLLGHSHGGVVAAAYAAAHPHRVERLVLASTLARFADEQDAAMEGGMNAKAGEPWYDDARAALEDEQAGRFDSDAELGELALREFPFYFATLRLGRARLPGDAPRRGAGRRRARFSSTTRSSRPSTCVPSCRRSRRRRS